MAERVSVELALAWRWRCEVDNQTFSGSTLRIINRNSGTLSPLASVLDSEVDRADLHHACGSNRVIAVAPDPGQSSRSGKT
jgi:hypothetical protein